MKVFSNRQLNPVMIPPLIVMAFYLFIDRKHVNYYLLGLLSSVSFSLFVHTEKLFSSRLKDLLIRRRIFKSAAANSAAFVQLILNIPFLIFLVLCVLIAGLGIKIILPVILSVNLLYAGYSFLKNRLEIREYFLSLRGDILLMTQIALIGSFLLGKYLFRF